MRTQQKNPSCEALQALSCYGFHHCTSCSGYQKPFLRSAAGVELSRGEKACIVTPFIKETGISSTNISLKEVRVNEQQEAKKKAEMASTRNNSRYTTIPHYYEYK